MKLTADDYRRRYSELSDEEFLSVDRDDLVEMARRCYDSEMAKRQLAPPEVVPPEERVEAGDAEPPDDWVQVAAFTFPDEAGAAEGLLQSADIPTHLANRHTALMNLDWTNTMGGLRLMVPASEVETSREMLQPYIGEGNKRLAERWFQDVWMNGHADHTAAAARLDEIRKKIPGFTLRIEDLLSEADRVAARISIHGKDVEFQGICILRVDAGAIAEAWIQLDWPSFREQVGR